MVSLNDKLANALTVLSELQGEDRHIFRSGEFQRDHRECLIRNGYLQPVIKGWLMLSSPESQPHDSTAWYASFWEFCARYCTSRFAHGWHLSPELSLRLHAEDTSVPRQVIVYAETGGNNVIGLPFDTGLLDLKSQTTPAPADLCEREGLRIYTIEGALMRVPGAFFRGCPVEARTVLASLPQIGSLLQRLLAGSHSTVAGRLAGAFRHIGRDGFADEIGLAMRRTEHLSFREVDPFVAGSPNGVFGTGRIARHSDPPISHRLRALWAKARDPVLASFPDAPGLPADEEARRSFLDGVSAAYEDDAYHSLSIEGYRVTPELIARVRAGEWDPETGAVDREQRDALAARGYWQAFQAVQADVRNILHGASAADLLRVAHSRWYFELFQPFTAAGLYDVSALAGYRNRQVLLRGSRHMPPRPELLMDGMATLFELLEQEPAPAVRAVAGHWLFGYIHPYPDGNGRIARFLMNTMLASGGFPWTTIRVDDRKTYMAALEAASVDQDVTPFAEFVARNVTA